MLRFFGMGFQADSSLFIDKLEYEIEKRKSGYIIVLDSVIAKLSTTSDWLLAASLEPVMTQLIEFLVVNMSIHQGHPDKYSLLEEKIK